MNSHLVCQSCTYASIVQFLHGRCGNTCESSQRTGSGIVHCRVRGMSHLGNLQAPWVENKQKHCVTSTTNTFTTIKFFYIFAWTTGILLKHVISHFKLFKLFYVNYVSKKKQNCPKRILFTSQALHGSLFLTPNYSLQSSGMHGKQNVEILLVKVQCCALRKIEGNPVL